MTHIIPHRSCMRSCAGACLRFAPTATRPGKRLHRPSLRSKTFSFTCVRYVSFFPRAFSLYGHYVPRISGEWPDCSLLDLPFIWFSIPFVDNYYCFPSVLSSSVIFHVEIDTRLAFSEVFSLCASTSVSKPDPAFEAADLFDRKHVSPRPAPIWVH